jgi:hypothetical protein
MDTLVNIELQVNKCERHVMLTCIGVVMMQLFAPMAVKRVAWRNRECSSTVDTQHLIDKERHTSHCCQGNSIPHTIANSRYLSSTELFSIEIMARRSSTFLSGLSEKLWISSQQIELL